MKKKTVLKNSYAYRDLSGTITSICIEGDHYAFNVENILPIDAVPKGVWGSKGTFVITVEFIEDK